MWNLCANGAQILRASDCKPIVGNPFRGFRQTQKSLTPQRQTFLYAENRFPGDESQRGLVVIHILLVQSTSQFSSPSRRQSLPRNNPRFAPAFRTMFVALENAKTSLFLALVRKVFLLVPLILLLPLILRIRSLPFTLQSRLQIHWHVPQQLQCLSDIIENTCHLYKNNSKSSMRLDRKNPPHFCWERGGTFWRIGWDSNPRAACATT